MAPKVWAYRFPESIIYKPEQYEKLKTLKNSLI